MAPEQAGLLQTLAQGAIAFAGFAGVIGSFSRFSTDARVTAFRVRGMVALALAALLIALAPFAIDVGGAEPSIIWRAASGFSAALAVILFVWLLRQVLPLFREKLLRTQLANFVFYGLSVAMIVSLIAVAVGALSAAFAWNVYALSLIFVLALCAYNFLMLVLSIRFD